TAASSRSTASASSSTSSPSGWRRSRSIEGCHGFAGAPRACGGRGAPRLRRGATSGWGVWGAMSGPPISGTGRIRLQPKRIVLSLEVAGEDHLRVGGYALQGELEAPCAVRGFHDVRTERHDGPAVGIGEPDVQDALPPGVGPQRETPAAPDRKSVV